MTQIWKNSTGDRVIINGNFVTVITFDNITRTIEIPGLSSLPLDPSNADTRHFISVVDPRGLSPHLTDALWINLKEHPATTNQDTPFTNGELENVGAGSMVEHYFSSVAWRGSK